jgi:ADP-heptose:LPS heptosyltransferase
MLKLFRILLNLCTRREFRSEDIRRILIIRMNRIGDMICTVPLIKSLRKEFPAARITVLAESSNAEIIRHEPYIDRVIVYERPSGSFRSRILNIIRVLKGADFDLAIGVKGGFSSFLAAAALLSGARFRIGYVARRKRLMNWFYNLPVEPVDFGSTHQVDACLNLLKPLKIKYDIKDITITIPSFFEDEAYNFLHAKGLKPKDRLAIFNISNTRENTSWSPDKFIRLGRLLIQGERCKCIISGVPSDEERALKICNGIGDGAFYFKTADIMHFAAITRLCNFLVTGEGGAGHAGAAAGGLVVSLFGSSDPIVWSPFGEQHISLKASDSDVNSITVEEVIDAMQLKGIESYL